LLHERYSGTAWSGERADDTIRHADGPPERWRSRFTAAAPRSVRSQQLRATASVEPWYDALDFLRLRGWLRQLQPQSSVLRGARELAARQRCEQRYALFVGRGRGGSRAEPVAVGSACGSTLTQSLCGPGLREDCAHRGLETLMQAFASWRPGEGDASRFRKFETAYGLERARVTELQLFAGARVCDRLLQVSHWPARTYWPLDGLALRGLVVNGWNNTLDDNSEKTFGFRWSTSPAPRCPSVLLAGGGRVEQPIPQLGDSRARGDNLADLSCAIGRSRP